MPASTRRSVALTGPSVPLDPRVHAIRPDLADVRLAGRVFAPHFVAPLSRRVVAPATLCDHRGGGEVIASLAAGDRFEVMEFAGERAWGVAPALGLVGYVDGDALGPDL